MRRTLFDFRKSRIPSSLGSCAADLPRLVGYVNEAQERLIYAGGETGWWGGWYRTVFTVTQANPYVTCGREIAAIRHFAVCGDAINVQNQWYEFLEAGIGTQPGSSCGDSCGILEAYDRGFYPSMVDVPTDGTYKLRVYPTEVRDLGKRILFTMLDQNGLRVMNVDGRHPVVDGEYIVLNMPFEDTVANVSKLIAVQKDVTYRDVRVYAVNTTTGIETLLSTYAYNETNPSYRRYYLGNLPSKCCGSSSLQVEGMAKLEYIPVSQDTDFLIVGNLPALKEECEAIRFGEMDNQGALGMAQVKHTNAIKLLNQELTHYLGKSRPAINQPLFGTATLESQNIGSLI